ncbi:MAG TPA: hypothetical protein VEX18_11630, partial [Polyangiaceae bacterium]|nr:hypothetical protein [Polyangiaceae bacterium]
SGHDRGVAAPAPPAAPPVASVSVDAPPKSPATTPGELRFGWEAMVRGATVVIDTRYTIQALFNTNFQGLSTAQKAEAKAHERIEVRVMEASGGQIRELEVNYVESESEFTLSDTPNDVESNKGKRYRVSFERGKPRVRALAGSASAEEEKGVLFDLATVTGYPPLVEPHLPTSLSPGWKARLDGAQVATMFGGLDTVKLDGAWLTLRGRDSENLEVALFDCGLPVRLERDGLAFSVQLQGTCTARSRDARPLDISLKGPLRAELNAALSAASTLTGTLEARITHSYTR